MNFTLKRNLTDKDETLFLDFVGTNISNLVVNDELISPEEKPYFDNGQIFLTKGLKEGKNTVKLHYINDYRNDGYGLHSFLDKEDGKQYLYTKFEPAFCHFTFPTFDQPDLKATLILRTITPGDWKIESNEYASPIKTEGQKDQVASVLQDVSNTFN